MPLRSRSRYRAPRLQLELWCSCLHVERLIVECPDIEAVMVGVAFAYQQFNRVVRWDAPSRQAG